MNAPGPDRSQLRPAGVALLALLIVPAPAAGQIDYRNLDDDRPTLIEDAYPIERHAFELLLPWRYDQEREGGSTHAFIPELEYGLFPNLQIGLKLPIAGTKASDGRHWGVSGLRLFGLYNFNTEGRVLPALGLRTDVTFPVGSLAGDGTKVTLKGIATRSWGRSRLHLNAAFTFGDDRPLAATEAAHKWWYGLAADRTLFRQSTLLIAEVYALRPLSSAAVEVNASIGLRRQLTHYLVVDAGVARRLRENTGPDYEITIGLSRAFAIAGLIGIPR
jgi:hypothetical protein